MLTDADRSEISELIAQKLDIVSAFHGLDVPQLEQIAADVEHYLYSRQTALRHPKNTYTPRWTVAGADVNVDDLGAGKGHLGPTLPQTIDLVGGTAYLDRTDPSILHLMSGGGGGADCMFNFLVSTCFASLTGFTEGMVFTSLSGCTFKGYSTVTLAVARALTDFPSTTPAVVFVCGGTYAENVVIGLNQYVSIYGAGQKSTVIGGLASASPAISAAAGGAAIWMQNLTIAAQTVNGGDGLSIVNPVHVDVRNCRVEGGTNTNRYGIRIDAAPSTEPMIFVGNDFSVASGGHYGLYIANATGRSLIADNSFDNCVVGVVFTENCTVTGNHFYSCTNGIVIADGATDYVISGNAFLDGTNDIIFNGSSWNFLITGNESESPVRFIDCSAQSLSPNINAPAIGMITNNMATAVSSAFVTFPAGLIQGAWVVRDNVATGSLSASTWADMFEGTDQRGYPGMHFSNNAAEINSSSGSAVIALGRSDGGSGSNGAVDSVYVADNSPFTLGIRAGWGIRFGAGTTAATPVVAGTVAGVNGTRYIEINTSGVLVATAGSFTAGFFPIGTLVCNATPAFVSWTPAGYMLSVPTGAGGGATASNTEAFVTIGNTAGLTAERGLALTPADGEHTFTDGGANASVTLVGVDTASGQKGHVAFDATVPAAIGTAGTGSAATTPHRDHVHPTGAGTPTTQAFGDAAATGTGPAAAMTNHVHGMPANPVSANGAIRSLSFIIDGGGSAISTGIKGDLEVPFACTINRVTMLADQSGSIVVDLWKDTYANYPPTVADTITASAKPTISAATKSQDATLTGWTTSIAAGDTLRYNVDSAATVTRVLVSLKVTET